MKKTAILSALLFCILIAVPLFCAGCKRDVSPQDANDGTRIEERDVSPPDVSNCTRIEIRYPRSTLNYFLPGTGIQRSILSPEEREYIESFEFFRVNDPELIKAFAHDVSLGSYAGRLQGPISAVAPAVVDCYDDSEHVISLIVLGDGDLILTEDDRMFECPRGLPNLEIFEPPEIRPFKLRYQCASNMEIIDSVGLRYQPTVSSYPEPNEWCDAIMQKTTNTSWMNEETMRAHFKCPAAGEGRCHYAMNPNCRPDSPPDTVLLFETKGGWNQYGGPELFTFDNHDPRGGCVLFNGIDTPTKFIRTKEELQQLRWK